MAKDDTEFVLFKVLIEHTYYVERYKGSDQTATNGWTVERVIQDWFIDHDINSHHATRESHEIGNGRKVLSSRVVKAKGEKG